MGDNSTTQNVGTSPSNGLTVVVDGEPVTIDSETAVSDLKNVVGAPDDDVATYRDSDDTLHALNDDDDLAAHVSDGTAISFQPARPGDMFGHTTG